MNIVEEIKKVFPKAKEYIEVHNVHYMKAAWSAALDISPTDLEELNKLESFHKVFNTEMSEADVFTFLEDISVGTFPPTVGWLCRNITSKLNFMQSIGKIATGIQYGYKMLGEHRRYMDIVTDLKSFFDDVHEDIYVKAA